MVSEILIIPGYRKWEEVWWWTDRHWTDRRKGNCSITGEACGL